MAAASRCSRPAMATTTSRFRPAASTSSTLTPSPTFRRLPKPATIRRQADRHSGKGRYLEAARHRLEAARAHHGESARRRHRSLRPDVQAVQSRPDARSTPSSTTFIPARRPAAWAAATFPTARGDCQALADLGFVVVEIDGMGTPVALQEIPRGLLTATWATTRCPTR